MTLEGILTIKVEFCPNMMQSALGEEFRYSWYDFMFFCILLHYVKKLKLLFSLNVET